MLILLSEDKVKLRKLFFNLYKERYLLTTPKLYKAFSSKAVVYILETNNTLHTGLYRRLLYRDTWNTCFVESQLDRYLENYLNRYSSYIEYLEDFEYLTKCITHIGIDVNVN